MAGSVSEYRGLGLNGGIYVNDAAVPASGNFFAIQATEETVLQAQTSNITNLDDICQPEDNITLAANTVLYGHFTAVDIYTGAVIAYNI
tara:strand:+ start:250 stop:516 length:267 start_codon:yes stop_codon:yes gene_type:complete